MKLRFLLIFLIFLYYLFVFPYSALAASLRLETDKSKLKRGKEIALTLFLENSERQETLGTDMVLDFDPAVLKVLSIETSSLYPKFVPSEENRVEDNQVFISGIAEYDQPVAGEGKLATIHFKSIGAGKTELYLNWKLGATNDTNIVDFREGRDLLKQEPNRIIIDIEDLSVLEKIMDFFQNVLRGVGL